MKKLLLFLFAGVALAQPPITGTNPTISCTGCGLVGATYHLGNTQAFSVSGTPGAIAGATFGDLAVDTIGHQAYICAATSCSAVGAANWQPIANAQNLQSVSVTTFGVSGNPATDYANFQTGINFMAGVGCLFIPDMTVQMDFHHVNIPSLTCIKGNGAQSIVAGFSSTATPGFGMFDINGSQVDISGFTINGLVTTPVGVLYSTALAFGPAWQNFTTGSSFWIKSGFSLIDLHDLTIDHTGGYAVFSDSTSGNISNVKLRRIRVTNSRPNLFGTSSVAENYGSWTGGFLFHGPGSTYNFENIVIDDNSFQNVVGNCIWFSNNLGTFMNRNVTVSNNNFMDIGLDAIQPAWIENYTEFGNTVTRFGYVVTSDIGSPRVGGPLWLQGFTPVAFDSYGRLRNFTRTANTAEGNGELLDCDGCEGGSVTANTFVSCFTTLDPLANAGSCGPSVAVGQNFTRGMTFNNSAGASGTTPLTITGNTLNGVGNGGIVAFGIQHSVISGNTIFQIANNDNPIVLGNLPAFHATNNLITGNNIFWSPSSGAAAVFEDGTSSAFVSTDWNAVRGNTLSPCSTCGGLMYEFQKATPDFSGTGSLTLSSVTPGAPNGSPFGSILQTEGTITPTFNIYSDLSGTGVRVGTFSPQGFVPIIVNFSALPLISGPAQMVYCANCTPSTRPCTGGGTGATAVTNASQWNCGAN